MRTLALLAAWWPGWWAGPAAGADRQVIDLAVERAVDGRWETADPATVFRAGEWIRFRFRSAASGYLYVLNETGDGKYLWLFPSAGAGTENRIESRQEYLVPATEGGFLIPDKPGYDTVYWIVTPQQLPGGPGEIVRPPLKPARRPNTLRPRCREGPLRARGVCVDSDAGARPLAGQAQLPGSLLPDPAAAPPVFEPSAGGVRIVSLSGGLVVYEFRVAHR